jgi:hypothetical protein
MNTDREPRMSVDTSRLAPTEIADWFTRSDPVPPHTFELALTLGGTVSAGAYTAGALDFLIQALDAWTTLRDNQDDKDPVVPQHKVVLRVVSGTSGGGVNVAIAARALNYDFTPVSRGDSPSSKTGNPFYDTWVDTLTLDGFLGTDDLNDPLESLLNGSPINAGKAGMSQFTGRPRAKPRSWLAAPLRTIFTLTNLRGVPYKLPFDPDRAESYIDHADYIRYAITYDGKPAEPMTPFRPDELRLDFAKGSESNWTNFAQFACGTAAFPAGFPPRCLSRPSEHYRYRVVFTAPDHAASRNPDQGDVVGLEPDWAAMGDPVPEQYDFLTVDGGATDNEPIELARTALCGVGKSNPRKPEKANRAVLLIDPFAGKNSLGPAAMEPFVSVLGAIFNTVIQQTRYDTSDLVLAADPNVLSRFMLTPNRKLQIDGRECDRVGADAIASAGVGAFIGFACPAFMHHDYMLGRKNCADFLRRDFTLPLENPVVRGQWTDPQIKRFAQCVSHKDHVPLIPLVDIPEQPLPAWPAHQLNPENYRDAIEQRFRGVLGTWGWWAKVAAYALQRSFANHAIEVMKDYLKKVHL